MTRMGWRTTGDAAEFLAAAGEYLRRERARNTVILTVSEQLRVNPARYASLASVGPASRPLLGWWTDEVGQVGGAFLHTPPHPVLLSAVPAAVAGDLARTLNGRPLAGANGYAEPAEAFAAIWQAATPGGRVTVERRMRLYRLGELSWPDPVPAGAARAATDADAPLLTHCSARSPPRRMTAVLRRTKRSPSATNSATRAFCYGKTRTCRSRWRASPGRSWA